MILYHNQHIGRGVGYSDPQDRLLLRIGMVTLSNVNIFRITGALWGESTGHRWIPLTKACDVDLWCVYWSAPEQNAWANNRDPSVFRRHRDHCDWNGPGLEILVQIDSYRCTRFVLTIRHVFISSHAKPHFNFRQRNTAMVLQRGKGIWLIIPSSLQYVLR